MQIQETRTARAVAVMNAILLAFAIAKSATAANKATTVAAPDGGQPVCAKMDAEGTIHLLLQAGDGPRYAKSTDNGKTFSKSIPVVDSPAQKPGLKFTAWDMVVGRGGRIHVALSTNAWKLKLPKEEWAFFHARLDPGAKFFSAVQNINRQPSEGFSLASDGKGNVAACWLSGKLYANVSRDDGKTFASAVEIDPTFDPCDCCTTSAVYAADGKLAVLYREQTDNRRDMFLVFWDQERGKASRTRVSSTPWKTDSCPVSYYAIARTDAGFTAVWPTKGDIYFARLDSEGTLQSPTEIKTPGATGMRTGMLALTAADGGTLVAWKKNDQLGWQLYDSQGRATGRPATAKSPGSGVAGVLNKNGEFVLFR